MNERKKILVVEDDSSLQNIIYRGLRSYPVVVLQAHSEEEAKKLFAENDDIDLILLDGCLSGDDPSALYLIPEFQKRPEVILVAMSSNPSLRQMMLERGCHHEVEGKNLASRKAAELLGMN